MRGDGSYEFSEKSMLADSDWVAAVFGVISVLVGGVITGIWNVYVVRRREL
jgi:hypothetical protein